jgi:cytochrome c
MTLGCGHRAGGASRRALREACRGTLALTIATLVVFSACRDTSGEPPRLVWGADVSRGAQLVSDGGCGACHVIPGVRNAVGQVGPSLAEFGRRAMIAGQLSNTPEQLERWLMNPPAIDPETAMPNLGLRVGEARDIAGYLYTLR